MSLFLLIVLLIGQNFGPKELFDPFESCIVGLMFFYMCCAITTLIQPILESMPILFIWLSKKLIHLAQRKSTDKNARVC